MEITQESVLGNAVGYNPRFPNVNQTKHCWASYVEYQKCLSENQGNSAPCKRFLLAYRDLCPSSWLDRFDEQLNSHLFPGQGIFIAEEKASEGTKHPH